MIETGLKRKKRLRNMLFVVFMIFVLLTVKIGWLQFVQGSELQAGAYRQQTMNRSINPKRGTIYDSTGKVELAVSSSVQTVTVNPTNIAKQNKFVLLMEDIEYLLEIPWTYETKDEKSLYGFARICFLLVCRCAEGNKRNSQRC